MPDIMYILNSIFLLTFTRFIVCNSNYDHIVFPRPLEPVGEDSEIPMGHMKPFGMQRAPEHPVKEYDRPLHPETFWKDHVKFREPLVFRNAISKSPAIEKWTDEYLNETYGDLDVLVELKRENRTFSTGRMRLSEFIENYKKEQLYVVSILPSPMMEEVQAVPSVMCGTFKHFTHESNFWYSSGGTRSVIHYDADQNFHCIIQGRKDVMMIKRKYEKYLYMVNRVATAGSGFSTVDPDKIDILKNPDIKYAKWTYASLRSGDCIYIPGGYLHQVRAYGRTLSATTLFTEEVNHTFSNAGCESFDADQYYPMTDINFHWTYNKGDKTIDMGYMNVERLRSFIRNVLKDKGGKERKLEFKKFKAFYRQFSYGGAQLTARYVWDKIFNITNGVLDDNTLSSLTRHQLKLAARALDPPHGPKTDGEERISLRPGEGMDNEMNDDEELKHATEEEKQEMKNRIEQLKREAREQVLGIGLPAHNEL